MCAMGLSRMQKSRSNVALRGKEIETSAVHSKNASLATVSELITAVTIEFLPLNWDGVPSCTAVVIIVFRGVVLTERNTMEYHGILVCTNLHFLETCSGHPTGFPLGFADLPHHNLRDFSLSLHSFEPHPPPFPS